MASKDKQQKIEDEKAMFQTFKMKRLYWKENNDVRIR
jgi:hypothetical protein